jgi:ABC-type sulfate/molybdate transport systems ATPase subunit
MSTLKTDLQTIAAAHHYGNTLVAGEDAVELALKLQAHNLGSLLQDYAMFRTTHGATAIADALLAAFARDT